MGSTQSTWGIKNKLIKLQMKFTAALIATMGAVDFEYMNEDELLAQLSSNLSSAQRSEARGDADAAVAKTAAIKNIQKDEGHRGHAATDQRYGEKTRYHAVCRASPRERHQDPPEGRRCQRNGQEMSTTSHLSSPESPRGLDALTWLPPAAR